MPRLLLILVTLLGTRQFSQAQEALWVFHAGYQSTSAKYTVRGIEQNAAHKPGIVAGASLKVPFENRFYFFPTIQYSLKGYKVNLVEKTYPPSTLALNNNTTLHTIDFAPLFQFDFSYDPSHVFVRFGPVFDYAVSGKETYDTLGTNGYPGTVKTNMVFKYSGYGRITASVFGQLGYQFKSGWMVFAHYNHGIGSMNNADDGPRIFHRIYGVSAGYLFGGKKKKQ
jgi:hypothetical protein